MLQLWLRCGLISGSMLCGWVAMFWVGISGTIFRNFLDRLLCRLHLLWGEFRLLFLSFFLCDFLWFSSSFFPCWCYSQVLSSNSDDSLKKFALRLPLFFLPCELRHLVVFVLFWSKNENNNSVDLVGLNSLLYDYRRVVFSFFIFYCVSHCCSWLLVLYWMRCLRIEHHLAAKFWTKDAASY